jgi:hypothetical protein
MRAALAACIVVIAGAALESSPAGSSTRPVLRFVSPPVVVFTKASPGGGWNYTLVARFDRPLPRTPGGGVAATFLVDGAEPGQSVFAIGVRARHCYDQALDTGGYPPSLRRPRAGRHVRFRVDFPGSTPSLRARVVLQRGSTDLPTPYARRLGCYAPTASPPRPRGR